MCFIKLLGIKLLVETIEGKITRQMPRVIVTRSPLPSNLRHALALCCVALYIFSMHATFVGNKYTSSIIWNLITFEIRRFVRLVMSNAMATSSLCSAVSPRPLFSSGDPAHSKTGLVCLQRRRRRPLMICASSDRDNYDGKLVDEDMIVLRMRIRDIEMTETSDRNGPPTSNWMEWEKRYHKNYNADVCEAVGLLQSQLMNTRPCLALGMLALVTLSVPVTTAALMSPLLDIIKGILASGFHL